MSYLEQITKTLQELNPEISFIFPIEYKKLHINAIEVRGVCGDLANSIILPRGAMFESSFPCVFKIGSELSNDLRKIKLIPMIKGI